MRKCTTLLLWLLLSATAFSQSAEPLPSYETYLKKSKKQKTAAWLLTSAGTAGLITTLMLDVNQTTGGIFVTMFTLGTVEPQYKSYTAYYLLSAAAVTGGIIYFIAAKKSRQKAAALQTAFKIDTAPVLHHGGIQKQPYPALSLNIPL